MRWIWWTVQSIIFWTAWLFLTAMVMFVHGDCWVHPVESEVAHCVDEKRLVGVVVLGIGAAIYGALVWRTLKRNQQSH